MRFLYILILCLFSSVSIIIANNIDSLEALLDSEQIDKYDIYCQLSASLWEIDTDKSKYYADLAVGIAKRNDDKRKFFKAQRNYGMIYCLNRQYDKALDTYNDILNYFNNVQDTIEVAALNRNIGDVYYRQAHFEDALKSYLKSEHIFQDYFKNHKDISLSIEENYGATLNNIGNIYLRLDDLQKSVTFFEKALEIQKKTGDKYSEAAAYTNIGNIYHYMQEYDKCLEFYYSGLDCAEALENYSLIANICQNIGATYQNQGKITAARKYYNKALDLFKKTDNDDGLMEMYNSIALSFIDENNRDSVDYYFDLAEEMARKVDDYQLLGMTQKDRSEYYKSIGNHEEAYNYLLQSQISKDSVITIEARKQINELSVKYESEQKDNLIRIKNLEMQQQENKLYLLYLAFGFVSIILCFTGWLYYNKNKNLKIIKEKNNQIEQANLELEQQNDYIIKQNEELSNLNNMKDKFFSIISHDMRNPVTSLHLLVDISQSHYDKGDYKKLPDKFQKFKNSINNLMTLFDNLLLWAKTQTGNMTFNKSHQNITAVVSDVATTFELISENKNISFKFEAQKDILLEVDKDMFEFIIRNLLSNAFKFTNEGGEVLLSLEEDTENVILKVKDNGIGLNEQDIDKMFMIHHKYSRAGTANEKGSGLGLTIVKEFIDLHQGTIEVQGKENEGAEFIIKFAKTR